jgi:hypothetical protein
VVISLDILVCFLTRWIVARASIHSVSAIDILCWNGVDISLTDLDDHVYVSFYQCSKGIIMLISLGGKELLIGIHMSIRDKSEAVKNSMDEAKQKYKFHFYNSHLHESHFPLQCILKEKSCSTLI